MPSRDFDLIEDDLGLRSGTVYNPMSSGIYIDQQLFSTPDLIRFYTFLVYRVKRLIHVIDGGVL